jgi:hypothetical protein
MPPFASKLFAGERMQRPSIKAISQEAGFDAVGDNQKQSIEVTQYD